MISLSTISFEMKTIYRKNQSEGFFFFLSDYCSFHAAICWGITHFWLKEIERKKNFLFFFFFFWGLLCVLTMDHAGVSTRYCASTKENEYLRWVFGFFLFSQEMNRMRCSDEWCHFLNYHIFAFSFLFSCGNVST